MQASPETSPSYSPSAQTAPEDISRIRIPAILYAFGTDTPSYLIWFDFENIGYVFDPKKSEGSENYPI